MPSDIQHIVESISVQVGRPALIEDRRQRVVAYSEQRSEEADQVRHQSILERHTRPRVIQWLTAAGIRSSRTPLRTPAAHELGLMARVCIPIYHDDVLLGFIWFLDADQTMTSDEISRATRNLEDLSLALYRENFLSELTSQAEASAARSLLLNTSHAATRIAAQTIEDGLLAGDGPTCVLVAEAHQTDDADTDVSIRAALENAAVATRRWLGAGKALVLTRGSHVTLIATGVSPSRAVAEELQRRIENAVADLSCSYAVGVGRTQQTLGRASLSYSEARTAAQIALLNPGLGPVSQWDDLGIYRVLTRFDPAELTIATVHPGIDRMMRTQRNAELLLTTLETYLDLAANATRAAQRLQIHRATLYYRLKRIEELADTDLRDGHERLCLHVATKFARIASNARDESPMADPAQS